MSIEPENVTENSELFAVLRIARENVIACLRAEYPHIDGIKASVEVECSTTGRIRWKGFVYCASQVDAETDSHLRCSAYDQPTLELLCQKLTERFREVVRTVKSDSRALLQKLEGP